jgi:hypothetical protein
MTQIARDPAMATGRRAAERRSSSFRRSERCRRRNWNAQVGDRRDGGRWMPGRGQERCSQDHAAEVLAHAMAGVAAGLAGIVTGGRDLGNLHQQQRGCAVLAVVSMGIDRKRRAQNEGGDEQPDADGPQSEPGLSSRLLCRCHAADSPRFIG